MVSSLEEEVLKVTRELRGTETCETALKSFVSAKKCEVAKKSLEASSAITTTEVFSRLDHSRHAFEDAVSVRRVELPAGVEAHEEKYTNIALTIAQFYYKREERGTLWLRHLELFRTYYDVIATRETLRGEVDRLTSFPEQARAETRKFGESCDAGSKKGSAERIGLGRLPLARRRKLHLAKIVGSLIISCSD